MRPLCLVACTSMNNSMAIKMCIRDRYDVTGATALALVMLLISFVMLSAVNALQWWAANRHRGRTAFAGKH